jgi:carboxyl-terminal processing protease
MTSRTRWIVLFVSTPVVAFVLVGGLLGRASADERTFSHLRIFEDVVQLILGNYVEPVDVDKVMNGAMRGLAEGLDADSAYLTAAETKEFERGSAATPAAGTVGIDLTRQYYLRVVSTRDGSPADKAGIRTGDSVRAIDGLPTRNLSAIEGMRLLRGPVGSKVKLTLLRDSLADPHELTLVREAEPASVVNSRMQAGATPGIGYVRVAAFTVGASGHLQNEIASLTKQGAAKLVIDLRGTSEGAYDEGIKAARLFVPVGSTIASLDVKGQTAATVTKSLKGDGTITLPVVILSTTGTSGAAEVFAAALVDNKRATLVGERTIGRAGVQKLVKLPDGSSLWMTYARYMAPSGNAIHGTGLTPSVEVEEPDVEFGAPRPAADPILDKAVEQFAMKKAA